jgi:radical SAM superfamily enzyme YgiQ (UPF0313 family)
VAKIVKVMIHSKNKLLFTPLTQLHMQNALLDNDVCSLEEIVVLEYVNNVDLYRVFSDITSHNPDIVTFSCYLWGFKAIEQLSFSLKEFYQDKDFWIIWGGPHVSESPIYFTKRYKKSIDFLVAWYGERPIQDIVSAWKATGGNLLESKRLIGRQRKKGIYFNTVDKFDFTSEEISHLLSEQKKVNSGAISDKDRYNTFKNLDVYGIRAGDFIPFGDLPQAYQHSRLPDTVKNIMRDRIFSLETYRGCPFACSYCLWGVADKKCDYHSEERMIFEFKDLVNHGARQFNFADAGFGLKKERDTNFLKFLVDCQKSLGYNDMLNVSGYFFWQTLTDEMLDVVKELIDVGVMGQMDVGIQTFNLEVTKIMKRPTNYARFDETIKKLQKREIPFQMDLILGLPGDDIEGYINSVKKVASYKPNKFQTFPLTILPGSDYDKRREELGIKTLLGSRTLDIDTIIETKTFHKKQIEKALLIESYFYLTYTLRLLNKTLDYVALVTNTTFFDVSMYIHDKSTSNKDIIFNLISEYFESLYEDRHEGRTKLDRFLFKNFSIVYAEIEKIICSYLKENKKEDKLKVCKEMLQFEFLIFPKLYNETLKNSHLFENVISKNNKSKSLIAEFSSREVLTLMEKKGYKVSKILKNRYLVEFSEPECNFREGGISTQYNFWKWNVSVFDKNKYIHVAKNIIKNNISKLGLG